MACNAMMTLFSFQDKGLDVAKWLKVAAFLSHLLRSTCLAYPRGGCGLPRDMSRGTASRLRPRVTLSRSSKAVRCFHVAWSQAGVLPECPAFLRPCVRGRLVARGTRPAYSSGRVHDDVELKHIQEATSASVLTTCLRVHSVNSALFYSTASS